MKLNQDGLCEDCEIIKRIKAKPAPTSKDINVLQMTRAKMHGNDLVEATCAGYHCAECSKYINRVYSWFRQFQENCGSSTSSRNNYS